MKLFYFEIARNRVDPHCLITHVELIVQTIRGKFKLRLGRGLEEDINISVENIEIF